MVVLRKSVNSINCGGIIGNHKQTIAMYVYIFQFQSVIFVSYKQNLVLYWLEAVTSIFLLYTITIQELSSVMRKKMAKNYQLSKKQPPIKQKEITLTLLNSSRLKCNTPG